MSNTPSIQVDEVNFKWPLYQKTQKQKHSKNAAMVGGSLSQKKGSIQVQALKNISFELNHGDRLALVGHNGAGKSTLLRLLAGIYEPTSGRIDINGKVSTLFTNAIGLQPEATGYENIFLMGKLLGINNITSNKMIREIEEFSELGEFLNLPLRTYSAGMRTRLGFAIATCIDSNILLIDEVIGAGDEKFQRKAAKRIEEKINTAGILVLALHSTISLRMFCNLGLWLDGGAIRKFGPIDDVLSEFEANIVSD